MTRQEAAKLVAICLASLPSRPIADEQALVTAWTMALSDVPYDLGQRAVAQYLREGKFFPAPAEIRALCIDAVGNLPTPGEAWRMVLDRMRSTYPGRTADDWNAPQCVKQAAAAVGGIHTLRMSEDPGYDQSRFHKVYATYRERAARDLDMAALWAGEEPSAIAAWAEPERVKRELD